MQNHRVRANAHVISHLNIAQNYCPGTDVYTVAEHRSAALTCAPQADGDTVTDDAVVSEYSITANNDAAKMFYTKSSSQRDLTGQVDARQYLAQKFQEPVKKREWQ